MGNQSRAGDDRDQLVYLSSCILVSHARFQRLYGSREYPIGLLCFRYHLLVWSGVGHLPNLMCQVQQRGAFSMSHSLPDHAPFLLNAMAWFCSGNGNKCTTAMFVF